jgi:hypothetical protein
LTLRGSIWNIIDFSAMQITFAKSRAGSVSPGGKAKSIVGGRLGPLNANA